MEGGKEVTGAEQKTRAFLGNHIAYFGRFLLIRELRGWLITRANN